MTQLKFFSTALACGILVACTGDGKDNSDGDGGGSGNGSGSGSGSGGGGSVDHDNNSGGPDEGADTPPTYPTQHPRIYIPAHKARLQAALAANAPEAARFRTAVDRYVNGDDIY